MHIIKTSCMHRKKNILHVISSPRGAESQSIRLGRAIIKRLLTAYPESEVVENHLLQDQPSFLTVSHLSSFFNTANNRSEAERQAIMYSDKILQEVKSADILVIGAPMYNFTIHAALKAWIDQLVRLGESFRYLPDGKRIGLFPDKQAFLAISTGGRYLDSTSDPIKNYIEDYLFTILGFIGINDITSLRIEGTAEAGFQANYDFITRNIVEKTEL